MKPSTICCLYFLMISTSGCGGVVGSIERYSFKDMDSVVLKGKIDAICAKSPNIIQDHVHKSDSVNYYKNFVLEKDTLTIEFKVVPSPINEKETLLILVSGGKKGEGLLFARNISYFKRQRIRDIFENQIVSMIEKDVDSLRD